MAAGPSSPSGSWFGRVARRWRAPAEEAAQRPPSPVTQPVEISAASGPMDVKAFVNPEERLLLLERAVRAWQSRVTDPTAAHARRDGALARSAVRPVAGPVLLLGADRGWAEVLLPGRPTGATGWVRADGVELRTVDLEVRVDLAERRLVLLEEGEVVLETAVAVGAPDAPTPTGRFSLTDKIASADPDGAYGPFALGLSARSEVFSEFGGGDGQIAIHGTDDPGSIGQAVSHGCVRVPDDVVRVLNERLPLGTPVVIS